MVPLPIAYVAAFLALAPSSTAPVASMVCLAQVLLIPFPSFVSTMSPALDLAATVWKSPFCLWLFISDVDLFHIFLYFLSSSLPLITFQL